MEDQINNEQEYQNFEDPEPQRPTGLTIACVLSFISAGFQFLGNIISFLAYNVMRELGQSEEYLEMMEKFVPDIDEFEAQMQAQLAVSRISYLVQALLFIGSFIGVLQMWNLKKTGFHIYAISQILILIATALLVSSVTGASMVGSVILTAIWIGIYFMYYKRNLQ